MSTSEDYDKLRTLLSPDLVVTHARGFVDDLDGYLGPGRPAFETQ